MKLRPATPLSRQGNNRRFLLSFRAEMIYMHLHEKSA
jgi:hypothetical protein